MSAAAPTTEPAFYDEAMTDPDGPAMKPLYRSPWLELYQEAAAWIHGSHPVVDLGCGTGRFAEQLRRDGHHGGFVGVDFSPAAIEEAKRYLRRPGIASHSDWTCDFMVGDLREWEPDPGRAGATVYVCLETLEHLADDVALVHRIPPGHELIFSVPNHESDAHLRHFRGAGDAWGRYGHLLAFNAWALIGDDARKRIHLYRARRRADSW